MINHSTHTTPELACRARGLAGAIDRFLDDLASFEEHIEYEHDDEILPDHDHVLEVLVWLQARLERSTVVSPPAAIGDIPLDAILARWQPSNDPGPLTLVIDNTRRASGALEAAPEAVAA